MRSSTTRLVGSTRLPTKEDVKNSPLALSACSREQQDLALGPWFDKIGHDNYESKDGTVRLFSTECTNDRAGMWHLHDLLNQRTIVRHSIHGCLCEAADLEEYTTARSTP